MYNGIIMRLKLNYFINLARRPHLVQIQVQVIILCIHLAIFEVKSLAKYAVKVCIQIKSSDTNSNLGCDFEATICRSELDTCGSHIIT